MSQFNLSLCNSYQINHLNAQSISLYLIWMDSSQEQVDMNEENLYVVEKILQRTYKMVNGRREPHYLIRWQGFPKYEDYTWQPLANLASVNYMVQQFQAKLAEKSKKEILVQSIEKCTDGQKHQFKSQTNKSTSNHNSFSNQEQDKTRKKIKLDYTHETKNKTIQYKDIEFKKTQKFKQSTLLNYSLIDKKSDNPQIIYKDQIQEFKSQKKQKDLDETNQKGFYGRIVNHFCTNGKIIYEVQRLNTQTKVLKISSISADKAKLNCLKSAYEYLQSYVIDLSELNKSK